MTIVSLFALSKESSVPFLKENFCSTSRTNVAFVFSGFLFFMPTIIMIFLVGSIAICKKLLEIYFEPIYAGFGDSKRLLNQSLMPKFCLAWRKPAQSR